MMALAALALVGSLVLLVGYSAFHVPGPSQYKPHAKTDNPSSNAPTQIFTPYRKSDLLQNSHVYTMSLRSIQHSTSAADTPSSYNLSTVLSVTKELDKGKMNNYESDSDVPKNILEDQLEEIISATDAVVNDNSEDKVMESSTQKVTSQNPSRSFGEDTSKQNIQEKLDMMKSDTLQPSDLSEMHHYQNSKSNLHDNITATTAINSNSVRHEEESQLTAVTSQKSQKMTTLPETEKPMARNMPADAHLIEKPFGNVGKPLNVYLLKSHLGIEEKEAKFLDEHTSDEFSGKEWSDNVHESWKEELRETDYTIPNDERDQIEERSFGDRRKNISENVQGLVGGKERYHNPSSRVSPESVYTLYSLFTLVADNDMDDIQQKLKSDMNMHPLYVLHALSAYVTSEDTDKTKKQIQEKKDMVYTTKSSIKSISLEENNEFYHEIKTIDVAVDSHEPKESKWMKLKQILNQVFSVSGWQGYVAISLVVVGVLIVLLLLAVCVTYLHRYLRSMKRHAVMKKLSTSPPPP